MTAPQGMLADRIEGLAHGAVLVESERALIVAALRQAAAPNQGREALEQIARVLYECERRRATNADAVIKGAFPNASDALLMEPFDKCAEVFRSDAAAVLAALTPAVAPDAGAGEANPLACRCFSMSEPYLSGWRLIVGFNTREEVSAAQEYVARLPK